MPIRFKQLSNRKSGSDCVRQATICINLTSALSSRISMSTPGSVGCTLYNRITYNPPAWISNNLDARIIPDSRIRLFNGPTPIHDFKIPGLEQSGLSALIKRDDLTSFDMSGNKVRKLEFLMAEALRNESSYDSVITIGGLQSNHARATAVAARQLGLDPYLILRTRDQPEDVNFVGNLLFNRYTTNRVTHECPFATCSCIFAETK